MRSLNNREVPVECRGSRRGMVAVFEMALLLAVCVGLVWAISSSFQSDDSLQVDRNSPTTYAVTRLFASPDQRHLCFLRSGQGLFRFDLITSTTEKIQPYQSDTFIGTDFSQDGRTVLSRRSDETLELYHDGKLAGILPDCQEGDARRFTRVAEEGQVAVRVAATGRIDGWASTGHRFVDFSYELSLERVLRFVCLNTTGHQICLVDADGSASIHETQSGAIAGRTIALGSRVVAVAWSDDERFLVAVTSDYKIRRCDLLTGQVDREDALDANFRACDFATLKISKDGNLVAVTTNNSSNIFLWSDNSATPVKRCTNPSVTVRALDFSPNGDRLYTGGYDGVVREWSIETCALVRSIH